MNYNEQYSYVNTQHITCSEKKILNALLILRNKLKLPGSQVFPYYKQSEQIYYLQVTQTNENFCRKIQQSHEKL